MPETEKTPPVLKWRGLLDDLTKSQRMMVFTCLAVLAINLVFTQSGVAAVSLSPTRSFYLVTLLAPVSLAALLLGAIHGAEMGLLCGVLQSFHALVQPLDYFEVVSISPVLSPVLFLLTGFLLGISFSVALRRKPQPLSFVVRVVLICFLVSVLFSIFFFATAVSRSLFEVATTMDVDAEILSNHDRQIILARLSSIGDPILQLVWDAVLMAVCCFGAARLVHLLGKESDERPLRFTFGMWLLIAVALGYLLTTAAGFVIITEGEKRLALQDMLDEVEYLEVQHHAQRRRFQLYAESLPENAELSEGLRESIEQYFEERALIEGYSLDNDGVILIAVGNENSASVLACNHPGVKAGDTVEDAVSDEVHDAMYASIKTGGLKSIVYGRFVSPDHVEFSVSQMGYLVARAHDVDENGLEYVIAYARPATKVFSDRKEVVRWMALSTFVLLGTVYLMVSRLLNKVVVRPMGQVNEDLDAICAGKLDTVIDARGSVEFVGLSRGINMTVNALKDWMHEAERRIEQELQTAQAIQESALPSLFPPFPEISEFDIYASMDPAREVGGDFYDFHLLDEGVLAFLIADVSGKGIPGALFMMEAKSELSNYMQSNRDLAEVVQTVNKRLCEGNEAGMFVTAWVAVLDYHHGLLTYVNAGHNPPLLRHNGEWRWLKERSGLFLGTFETATYRSFQLQLAADDELMLYTDGVNEAFNVDGEEYGNDRLEAFLAAHADLGPRDLVDELKASVAAWTEGAEQSDDITMLALDFHPSA